METSSTSKGAAPRRRRPQRLLALLLGVALVPVLLELGLRGASLLVSSSRAGEDGECLVLCQGDSNVFGLYLPEGCSFPGQLQALLASAGAESSRVVNRGVPGKASWTVRDELDSDLARYRPRAVALLVGMNSRWSVPPERESQPWFASLRVVRCWRLMRNAWLEDSPEEPEPEMAEREARPEELADWLAPPNLEHTGSGQQRVSFADRTGSVRPFLQNFGQPTRQEFQAWIRADLVESVRKIRAAGALPLLMLYPLDERPFNQVNEAILAAAVESGARVIDPRETMARAVEEFGRHALFFDDLHATDSGNAVMARELMLGLIAEGVVDSEAMRVLLNEPLGGRSVVPRLAVAVSLEGADAPEPSHGAPAPCEPEFGVSIEYAPGFSAQLLVSSSAGETGLAFGRLESKRPVWIAPPDREARFTVALGEDELLRACLDAPELRVRLDAQGRGRIAFPPPNPPSGWPALATAFAPPVRALVLVLDPRGGVAEQSEVFELAPER